MFNYIPIHFNFLLDMENPESCQKFKEFDILWTSIGICTAMNSKPNELIYEV